MATWPELRTLEDVSDAWLGLVPVHAELVELAAAWHAAGPKAGFLADFHEANGPGPLRQRVKRLLQALNSAPEVEPINLADTVSYDAAAAFWANHNGIDVLRARRKAGQPVRGQLRSLAEHVNHVLFPALVEQWTDLSEQHAAQLPGWLAWLEANPVAPAPTTAPPKGPPSWH